MEYEDALQLRMLGIMKMIPIVHRIRQRDGPMSALMMMHRWDDWFDRTEAGLKLGELYARQYALIRRDME